MNLPSIGNEPLPVIKAIFFAPVLFSFVAGSLPLLLPYALYRWLVKPASTDAS